MSHPPAPDAFPTTAASASTLRVPPSLRSRPSRATTSGVIAIGFVATALLLLASLPVAASPHHVDGVAAGVAADHPDASTIGRDVLARGGHAVDAAVATVLALGVLNNFASGIGGGGFALVYDAASGETFAFDFREVAPAALHAALLDPAQGATPDASRRGGLAVGVPAEVEGLWTLHQRWGRLPWAELVEPSRRLAAEGFVVHPLLESRAQSFDGFEEHPNLVREFGLDGRRPVAGQRQVRPRLAQAFALIASEGAAAFRAGPIADDIVASVRAAGGVLTHADLGAVTVVEREPMVVSWSDLTLMTFPLPSSGGEFLARTLPAVDSTTVDLVPWGAPGLIHRVVEAWQFAFAERASTMGDPIRRAPGQHPNAAERGMSIRDGIDPVRTHPAERYGAIVVAPESSGTSHVSIVDAEGNAVALTTTVNTSFGSGVVSERFGILLNNQMDDFATSPGRPNAFGLVGSEANRVEPGARPLSSMCPVIVLDDAGVRGVVGASGGPTILTSTFQVLVAMARWGRSPGEAVVLPRVHHQWLPPVLLVERGFNHVTVERLRDAWGYEVREADLPWAVQAIWRDERRCWNLASDPRKQGGPAGVVTEACSGEASP